MNIEKISACIKNKAIELGFNAVGFTSIKVKAFETNQLIYYLNKGYNAQMKFLNKNIEIRKNINIKYPWAKSIVICLLSYYPKVKDNNSKYKISFYAYGNDYHLIFDNLLKLLENYIKEIIVNARTVRFCDTSPIFEKSYACDAGLGWIGKNTLLINKNLGSYVFIGGIITDVELLYDTQDDSKCPEDCNLCIKNCPTNALVEPYVLDASKCISYQTVENKTNEYFNSTYYIAGCDFCQKNCPFNKKDISYKNNFFIPNSYVKWTKNQWESLNETDFYNVFKNTIFKRIGYSFLKRNINVANEIDNT